MNLHEFETSVSGWTYSLRRKVTGEFLTRGVRARTHARKSVKFRAIGFLASDIKRIT